MLLCFSVHGVVDAKDIQLEKPKNLTIAVSSNFFPTMQKLAIEFKKTTGNTLKLSSGSTGKHYAQIKNGAPFDVFFSADEKRPKLLEQQGLAMTGTRFTYAVGRLALVGYELRVGDKKLAAFSDQSVQRLAMANPRLAPYGLAAKQALSALGVWNSLEEKIVRGENVNQAFQFVVSGNAQIGLVSYAQIIHSKQTNFWLVPSDLYAKIEQQAVVIKDSKVARELVAFMRSQKAQNIIKQEGYGLPNDDDFFDNQGVGSQTASYIQSDL